MSTTMSSSTVVRKHALDADVMLVTAMGDLTQASMEAEYVGADAKLQAALQKAFELLQQARKEITTVLSVRVPVFPTHTR